MTLSLKEQLKHWGHYQEHRFAMLCTCALPAASTG